MNPTYTDYLRKVQELRVRIAEEERESVLRGAAAIADPQADRQQIARYKSRIKKL